MTSTAQLAKHIRELHFGGNWTSSNLKDQLAGVTWKQATQQVHSFKTIATLVFHVNYYVSAVSKVLDGETLQAKDEFSFNHPPINTQEDWEALVNKTLSEAETFAAQIEHLPDNMLSENFTDEKYGSYYRNLLGIIEHTHYHLGQIALIKTLVVEQEPWIKSTATEDTLSFINTIRELENLPFHPRENIQADLDLAFELILPYINENQKKLLQYDLEVFMKEGRFTVHKTYHGGILFLKVPETIERISLQYFSDRPFMNASVTFASDHREIENIKSKPDAGKTESTNWYFIHLFPHIHEYPDKAKTLLLTILAKMIKTICERYRDKGPYMNLVNDFYIELSMDNQIRKTLNVDLPKVE